jgi:Haemolymph juvenile hormone binding protein (JHBP).
VISGEEMNAVLNKQWRDVFKDLGGPIVETANIIIQQMTNNFAKVLPLDAWFPEKV